VASTRRLPGAASMPRQRIEYCYSRATVGRTHHLRAAARHSRPMTSPTSPQLTTAFYVQAILSFGIALAAIVIAILYLPIDPWVRAFLGLSTLYLVTFGFHPCQVR
jgi:hypothetical protein